MFSQRRPYHCQRPPYVLGSLNYDHLTGPSPGPRLLEQRLSARIYHACVCHNANAPGVACKGKGGGWAGRGMHRQGELMSSACHLPGQQRAGWDKVRTDRSPSSVTATSASGSSGSPGDRYLKLTVSPNLLFSLWQRSQYLKVYGTLSLKTSPPMYFHSWSAVCMDEVGGQWVVSSGT